MLVLVRRKVHATGKEDHTDHSLNTTQHTLNPSILQREINHIRQQQDAIQSDLAAIQRDSQMLWTETMASRERHRQQQEIIDKILRFLASVFSGDKLAAGTPNLESLGAVSPISGSSPVSTTKSNSVIPKSSNINQVAKPTSTGAKRQRLLIEDPRMDPALREQVMELITRQSTPPVMDAQRTARIDDLTKTTDAIASDIAWIEDTNNNNDSDADALLGFDDPVFPDPPGSDFDISKYIIEE